MNKRFTKSVVVFLALLLILPLNIAVAQDDMMEEKIVCDSTLILTLLVAEYDLGYEPMMDVSVFEKGQYASFFDAMMMMMDEEMMDEEMGEDEMMDDEEMMDEEMSDDEMMEEMVTLEVATVEGEDPACTELRASLDAYLYEHFTHVMMMEEDDM